MILRWEATNLFQIPEVGNTDIHFTVSDYVKTKQVQFMSEICSWRPSALQNCLLGFCTPLCFTSFTSVFMSPVEPVHVEIFLWH